jgi:hypothetical protein
MLIPYDRDMYKWRTWSTPQAGLLNTRDQNLGETEAALGVSNREAAQVARAVHATTQTVQVVAASTAADDTTLTMTCCGAPFYRSIPHASPRSQAA